MAFTTARVGLVLAVAGLLAACGKPTASYSNVAGDAHVLSGPIEVLGDTELARGLDTSIDVAVPPFVVDSGVGVAGAVPELWSATDGAVDDETVARLAEALSVTDPVQRLEGGWFAGSYDPGATRFEVSLSNGGWFQLHRGPSTSQTVEPAAGPCPTQPFSEPHGGQCVEGWQSQPVAVTSTAPAPSNAVVERAVFPVVGALGIDVDDLRLQPSGADASAVQVRVLFRPAGVWSDLEWNFELGSDGEVQQAYGPTGPVKRCCDVATVGLDEGLVRLARQMTPVPAVIDPAMTVPPMSVPPMTDPTVIDPTSALPQPVPEIAAVEWALISVWGIDGNRWLVPAYLFTGEQISATVAAIDAAVVRLIDPRTIPQPPAPSTTMPIVTPAATTTMVPIATTLPMPTSST